MAMLIFTAFLRIEVDAYRDNKLYIYFLDVGQGDALYIRTPDRQDIVIDGGPDNVILAELGKLMSFYDRKIELLVLTHPHEDHINGLIEVVERYKIDKILMPDIKHDSAAFYQLQKSIENNKIPIIYASENQEIDMGLTKIKLYNPEKEIKKDDNVNNISVVARLIYGNTAALLTGDAEEIVEKRIVNNHQEELRSELLKAGHHGSKTSSTEKFVEEVKPNIAVISVGQGNKYNHPHTEVLERFDKNNISIFRTDYQGTIKCISDAIKFDCQGENF